MKAYISLNNQSRKTLSKELIALGMALNGKKVEQYIFVDKFSLEEGGEKEYLIEMQRQIDSSNFLIIDGANVHTTNCVEVGYARAKKKPIVYLRNENTAVDPILLGASNFYFTYENPKDLFDQMNEFLKQILPQE
ncbi:hypothetical protein AB4865_02715 [Capnocytophaga sp. ARDL2]|uniref:hypothetical protein n=1 Tax=Capnocytophaga sp. ARDL2 TaxID=3238809 RepID=UPI003558C7F6